MLQRQAAGNRILRMTAKFSISFRNAGNLSKLLSKWIQILKKILAGIIEINLVCCHQGAQRKRIIFNKFYCLPVRFPRRMGLKINSFDLCIQSQGFCPLGKHTHNRRFSCSNTNKINCWPFSRFYI